MKMHLIMVAMLASFPYASAGSLAVHSQVDAPVEENEDKLIIGHPDRRLKQRERSLQENMETNIAFEADVAMPIRLQSAMKKTSGDSNRRLQTVQCFGQDNGLLVCVQYEFPGDGLATVFLDCPVFASTVSECQSCSVVVTADYTPNEIDLDNDPQCLSCSICSDILAYDCSNLGEGTCVILDCDGTCTASNGGGGGGDGGGGDGGSEGDVVYGLQPTCNSIDSDNYNMCLDLVSLSGSYETWMDSFAKAMLRWERFIVGNLPSISSAGLDTSQEFVCTSYPSTINDVYICGRETSIDGEGGVLGQASPLYVRGSGVVNPRIGEEYQVVLSGMMEFDSADIAALQVDGQLDEVIFHEMGHVLGVGTLWEANGLYNAGSGEYASGTHADDEWKAIGCSGPLPVELDNGPGTADGHWDEECLGNELMTGFISGSSQPVSKITIGTLEDMGYGVDYSQADAFTTADLDVCGSSCPEARRGLRRTDRSRKMKAKLGSEDYDAIMLYAKTALTKRHAEMELAALVRGGDIGDGITAVEELDVLYLDAAGNVHAVHVKWTDVSDP